MKKFILVVLAIFVITPFICGICAAEQAKTVIYVSHDGDDKNPGTAQMPLKTVSGAVAAIEKVKNEDSKVPIDVIFSGGEYRITKSVAINSKNSGTKEGPVTFKAADGEKPVFTSGILLDIDKFTEITDMDIYERLQKDVRDKIGELDLKQYGITTVPKLPTGMMGASGVNYYLLYLDSERQTLARWPDAGYEKIAELVDKNNSVFRPEGTDITRWGSAKVSEIHLSGFLKNQYGLDRTYLQNIDVKERTIQLPSNYTISGSDRRYFLHNFLEELNYPGEWYINSETMKLYYYPEHKLSDERLEIVTLTTPMFNLNGASYINFDGISFEKTNIAIQITGCNNINITNCKFDEMGRNAIYDTQSTNMKYYFDKAVPSSDIWVDSCIMTDIGAGAVVLAGGDYYTLTPGNIKITNNYITRFALDWKNYAPAIDVTGVGCEVYNNTIHDAPGNGIQTYGNDHKIMYNEIYEILKDVHDAGGVYEGRSAIRRGTEFAYNYYHDLKMTDTSIGDMVCGLYMDDGLCEWNIHHNIFDNCIKGLFIGGGDYSTVENNMFINCPIGPQLGFYINENRKQYIIEAEGYLKKYPAYQKYHMENMMDVITLGNTGNKINDNLLVNSLVSVSDEALERNNEAVGNLSYISEEEAGFKDWQNKNYEIKEDSKTAKALPGLLDIDMDKIGISKEMWEKIEKKDIVKYAPANGSENVSSSKVTFRWESDNICDKYIFTLATDAEMKNIVYTETARYNFVTLNNVLKPGKRVYYWNVVGVDSSKECFENVKSRGEAYRLVTSSYDETNKLYLNEEIEKAKETMAQLSVGNETGQCSQETIDKYEAALNKALNVQKTKYSTQTAVDNCVDMLIQARIELNVNRNIGYENLDYGLRNETWRYQGTESGIKDGVLTVKDRVAYMDSVIPAYKVLAFKMKPDKDYTMIAVTLRLKQLGIIWSGGAGGDGYTIIIKPGLVEYQRYKGGKGGILKTVENLYLKAGEWNDIEVGCVPYKEGVKTIFRVNGHDVLNEYDDSRLITDEGGLQFENFNNTTGLPLEIMGADNVGEFSGSIVTGKLQPLTPVYVDSAENLDIQRSNGVTKISGLLGNEILNFETVLNGQDIALRSDEENEYRIKITEERIVLERITKEGNSCLISENNEKFQLGEKVNLTLGAYPCEEGMRIMLYKNNEKIIDYIDSYSKHNSAQIKIYENGRGSIFAD